MKIVTHNSRAHLDDFLACCILVYQTRYDIERKSFPTDEDLLDPEIFVVDFGKQYNPILKNFDHHQITGGSVCAFTQILEYYNIRDYKALPWIKFVEEYDHNGPVNAMKLVGGGSMDMIFSPIQETLIKEFSNEKCIEGFSVLSKLMNAIGKTIFEEYDNYYSTLNELSNSVKVLEIEGFTVIDYTNCNINNDSSAIALKHFENDHNIEIILNKNERGSAKLRMIRRSSNVNFNLAKEVKECNISFIHQSGFLITFDQNPELILKELNKNKLLK